MKETLSNFLREKPLVAGFLLLLVIFLFTLARCNDTPTIEINPDGSVKNAVVNITFTVDGEFIITTPDGKIVPPTANPFPVKVSTVRVLKSLSIMETSGSPVQVWIDLDNQITCIEVDYDESTRQVTRIIGPCNL
ncbi:hypothetical protein [Nitrosococcus oceani]|uniref:hypothetical protein n=1 Tax=Nitrosococcus oceani TaxID=1229 RepID=UPI0004E8BA21|nr:hypothetical protein [Nitrosococcus oceani]KFI23166.1 hypothetical protein HW44_05330 [Nitrosococcus oceani]